MWFAPKSSQVLRVWHETSLWKSWMDLPEVLCLLMALFIIAVSRVRVIGRFVRSRGVPETRAGLRGITGNLDRRQNQQEEEEATKTGRKTAAPGLAFLLGPHRSLGTLTWKHSPLRVFNKCHLTLGEALAVSPRFGGMRTCSGFGQLAGPISTLAGSIRDFMAVCPPWCFFMPHAPLGLTAFFFCSLSCLHSQRLFTYFPACLRACDLCTWGKKRAQDLIINFIAAVLKRYYAEISKTFSTLYIFW